LATQLATYEKSYSTATTAAAKHAAYVAFWKFVGSYSTGGDGSGTLGIADQAWNDLHQPELEHNVTMWSFELGATTSLKQYEQLDAQMANAIVGSGYVIPLNYSYSIVLEKTWLTGAQPNWTRTCPPDGAPTTWVRLNGIAVGGFSVEVEVEVLVVEVLCPRFSCGTPVLVCVEYVCPFTVT
jgi:hypothetical protein